MSFNSKEYIDKLLDNFSVKYSKFKKTRDNTYEIDKIPNLITDGYNVFGIINSCDINKKNIKRVRWNPNICIEYNYPVA